MSRFRLLALVMICATGPARADPALLDPGAFKTSATFAVDDTAMSLSSALATIEPRAGAPGYSWLRIYFYSFAPTAEDVAGAMKGSVESMERRVKELTGDPGRYNTSHAEIQLTVDQDSRVWQVDMAIPGHGCTIAPFEPDVKAFLQDYRLAGQELKLRSKGSYLCDMAFMGIPNQKFAWDIDLDIPVFAKAK
jgi:hypothetical protein